MVETNKQINFWVILGRSFSEWRRNDMLRMAGATSFFATFALPPILIILFQAFTLFLSQRYVGSEMMEILTETFGRGSAEQIRVTTRGFRSIANTWYLAAGGFIFLLFVATTLFSVIKNTLNDIWDIRVKERPGILVHLKLRGKSLLILCLAGLLFLISVLLEGVEAVAGSYMQQLLPGTGLLLGSVLSEVISLIIVTAWFILLFRYLGDARPHWITAITGGGLTGVLFSIGRELLSYLVQRSNVGTIYGASGSLVLLLLFIFYASFILYFGACFIKVHAEQTHRPLKPLHHAFHYELQELEAR
jgi:membrane protein